MHTMFFFLKYQIDALQILIPKTSDFMIHSSEIQGHGNYLNVFASRQNKRQWQFALGPTSKICSRQPRIGFSFTVSRAPS